MGDVVGVELWGPRAFSQFALMPLVRPLRMILRSLLKTTRGFFWPRKQLLQHNRGIGENHESNSCCLVSCQSKQIHA